MNIKVKYIALKNVSMLVCFHVPQLVGNCDFITIFKVCFGLIEKK